MTIPTGGYPKMPFATDPVTGRTTNLVYPTAVNHANQGAYVIFNNASDESSYDNTGIPAVGLSNRQENKHHK